MTRRAGGFIGATRTPGAFSPGMWDMRDVGQALASGRWPTSPGLAVEYLVVGGGGGSARLAGGAGGGGVLMGSMTLAGMPHPITVGVGGAASIARTWGSPGGDSSIGTLVVALGGGAAAGYNNTGVPSGSGGSGAGYAGARQTGPGLGTPGQGYDGGAISMAYTNSSGGGGAGGVGGNGNDVALTGGNGGPGKASDISGTLTYYGGGGGGGGTNGGGLGGIGGGGVGGRNAAITGHAYDGQSGFPNTGGGGGGTRDDYTPGSGGSGIVILRYPGPPRATGGTITEVGGYTIHTFTSSGEFAVILNALTLLPSGWEDYFGNEAGIDVGASTNEVYTQGLGYSPAPTTPATSYANPGGTGNRTASIALTSTIAADSGAVTMLVDGDTAGLWNPSNGTVEGHRIVFDFGAGNEKYIDEVTFYQSSMIAPNFRWQYSLNGVDFVDLNSFVANVTGANVIPVVGMPFTGARYFSLCADAGVNLGGGYMRELEFKLASGASAGFASMQLVSANVKDADAPPNEIDVSVYIKQNEAVTVNSDVLLHVSRDDGTTWKLATLVLQSTEGSTAFFMAENIDMSSEPSGVKPRYRVTIDGVDAQLLRTKIEWA